MFPFTYKEFGDFIIIFYNVNFTIQCNDVFKGSVLLINKKFCTIKYKILTNLIKLFEIVFVVFKLIVKKPVFYEFIKKV